MSEIPTPEEIGELSAYADRESGLRDALAARLKAMGWNVMTEISEVLTYKGASERKIDIVARLHGYGLIVELKMGNPEVGIGQLLLYRNMVKDQVSRGRVDGCENGLTAILAAPRKRWFAGVSELCEEVGIVPWRLLLRYTVDVRAGAPDVHYRGRG